MRRRPHSRQPSQSPIRCGHDPAGLRSALCRDSVRNGYALSRCVAPRCRKPTHEPPICARSVPKAALARPLPTRQTRKKGRLNFLYPAKPGDTGTDWRALAHTAYQAKLTLVIYMGVSGAAHIQDELLYGLPDTTPVAIVHNASLPTQRHAVCTLGELQTTIAREGLASPSVIVVGDVMQGLLAAAQVPEREPLGQTRTA